MGPFVQGIKAKFGKLALKIEDIDAFSYNNMARNMVHFREMNDEILNKLSKHFFCIYSKLDYHFGSDFVISLVNLTFASNPTMAGGKKSKSDKKKKKNRQL